MEEGNNLFSKINNLEEIEKENNKLLLELLNKNSNNFIEILVVKMIFIYKH